MLQQHIYRLVALRTLEIELFHISHLITLLCPSYIDAVL
jgi:hypothetical protein